MNYTTEDNIELRFDIRIKKIIGQPLDNIHAEIRTGTVVKTINVPDEFQDATDDSPGYIIFNNVPLNLGVNIIDVYVASGSLDVDGVIVAKLSRTIVRRVENLTVVTNKIT